MNPIQILAINHKALEVRIVGFSDVISFHQGEPIIGCGRRCGSSINLSTEKAGISTVHFFCDYNFFVYE